MKPKALMVCAVIALAAVVTLFAQGSIPSQTRVRTDASNYLITTGAAYTGPDSPPTNFLNARIRTDANGYLITTSSPSSSNLYYAANGTVAAPSYTFSSETGLGLFRPGAGYLAFAELGVMDWTAGGGNFIMATSEAIGWAATANPYSGAFDTKLQRAGAGEIGFTTPVLFAALGTPANGSFCYCSDCTIANPCASGGTGAFAKRLNGVWVCN
jgi:hypothetical protein